MKNPFQIFRTFLLKCYRSERALTSGKQSPIATRYERLLQVFGKEYAQKHCRSLDYWTSQSPFRESKRLFGKIESVTRIKELEINNCYIIRGWVFDVRHPLEHISLWLKDTHVGTAPLWEERPDVAEAFPGESFAGVCGFEIVAEFPQEVSSEFRFIVMTTNGDRLHGYFPPLEQNVLLPQSVSPADRELFAESAPRSNALAITEYSSSGPYHLKFQQALDFLQVASRNSMKTTLIVMNCAASALESLPKLYGVDTLLLLRSRYEFQSLLEKVQKPGHLLLLCPDALWFCEQMYMHDVISLYDITLIDDTTAHLSEVNTPLKDSRDHKSRSRFCQIFIEAENTSLSHSRADTDPRFFLTAPNHYQSDEYKQLYSKVLEIVSHF